MEDHGERSCMGCHREHRASPPGKKTEEVAGEPQPAQGLMSRCKKNVSPQVRWGEAAIQACESAVPARVTAPEPPGSKSSVRSPLFSPAMGKLLPRAGVRLVVGPTWVEDPLRSCHPSLVIQRNLSSQEMPPQMPP